MPKSFFASKLPVPVPSRIATLLPAVFATARSSLPSPLKSPTAIEAGLSPVWKSVFALNGTVWAASWSAGVNASAGL